MDLLNFRVEECKSERLVGYVITDGKMYLHGDGEVCTRITRGKNKYYGGLYFERDVAQEFLNEKVPLVSFHSLPVGQAFVFATERNEECLRLNDNLYLNDKFEVRTEMPTRHVIKVSSPKIFNVPLQNV